CASPSLVCVASTRSRRAVFHTLSLHDALPIYSVRVCCVAVRSPVHTVESLNAESVTRSMLTRNDPWFCAHVSCPSPRSTIAPYQENSPPLKSAYESPSRDRDRSGAIHTSSSGTLIHSSYGEDAGASPCCSVLPEPCHRSTPVRHFRSASGSRHFTNTPDFTCDRSCDHENPDSAMSSLLFSDATDDRASRRARSHHCKTPSSSIQYVAASASHCCASRSAQFSDSTARITR